MSDHEAVANVLLDAHDKIERDGWYQGSYAPDGGNDDGGVGGLPTCALGAIYAPAMYWSQDLCTYLPSITSEMFAAIDALAHQTGIRRIVEIPRWNDSPARTKQEVLDAFQAAAKAELKLADGAS